MYKEKRVSIYEESNELINKNSIELFFFMPHALLCDMVWYEKNHNSKFFISMYLFDLCSLRFSLLLFHNIFI